MEKPVHEAGTLQDVAHEQKQRDGRKQGLRHHREHLQRHQEEHHLAEADVTEDDAEKDQRERDRKPDEDEDKQRRQRQQAEIFGTHAHRPCLIASMHFKTSDTPCTSRSAAVSTMTLLNG